MNPYGAPVYEMQADTQPDPPQMTAEEEQALREKCLRWAATWDMRHPNWAAECQPKQNAG